jgi:multidrug resistance efflux pump
VTISIVTIDDDVIFLPSDMVVAEWPARVGKVLVDEGEFVLQGAPVLTLNEPDFTITLSVTAEERSDLEVGQTVSVSLDAVDADLNGTIATLDENATVADDGSETYEGTVEVDGDVAAVDGARATIDVTLSERPNVLAVPVAAVLRSAGGDEVRVINDAGKLVRAAEAEVSAARAQLAAAQVSSPIKARILKVRARVGAQAGGRTELFKIGDTSSMVVVAEIYESEILKIKTGQKAVISSPAVPKKMTGTVTAVSGIVFRNTIESMDPNTSTQGRVVEATILMDQVEPLDRLVFLQVDVTITL